MPKDVTVDVQLVAADGKPVSLPNGEKVANAEFLREGQDLLLQSPDGHAVKIAGYFDHTPDIVMPDGGHITPAIVKSFLGSSHPGEYAANDTKTATDATPVGKVTEVTGECTITRGGEKIVVKVGTEIMQGDVVATDEKGALNILFADNTTFAISHNARLSIDQFVYNSGDHEGSSFFSMLQGMFVYTSGLIGKEDPGHVGINTPVGSIGIRGTVVAGNIQPEGHESSITIVDGAVVVTNGGGTFEMNQAFDTVSLSAYGTAPTDAGVMDTAAFTTTYSSLAPVADQTFGNISNGTFAPSTNGTTPDAPAPTPDTPHQDAAPTDTNPAGATPNDGSIAPPPPPADAQPTDGSVPSQGGQLAPSPAPATDFGSAAGTQFADTGATTFGSTGTTAPSTGGTATAGTTVSAGDPTQPPATGTTTTAPPVITPPVASMVFNFDNAYKSYAGPPTGTTADDGINITWDAGQLVGQLTMSNFPVGVTPVFQFQGGGPDLMAQVMQYDLVTTGNIFDAINPVGQPDVAILHVDPATGAVRLVDPFAFFQGVNSNLNVTIEAIDPATGKVIASAPFLIQINSPGLLTDHLQVGDVSAGASIDAPTGVNDFLNGTTTTGSDILFGRDGADNILLDPNTTDTALGGAGSDIIGLIGPSFRFIDGGQSTGDLDILVVGSTAPFPQNYDFRGAKIVNIEEIKLSNTGPGGPTVTLSLKDVFDMTDDKHGTPHSLTILNDVSGTIVSQLNIDLPTGTVFNTGTTAGVGSGANFAAGDAGGTVTINASFNSQTVTLVIETGVVGSGVAVHIN